MDGQPVHVIQKNCAKIRLYAKRRLEATAQKFEAARLFARGDRDPFGFGGDAFGQSDFPAAFAVVHFEKDSGLARRMVGGGFDEEKIRPHLRDADG